MSHFHHMTSKVYNRCNTTWCYFNENTYFRSWTTFFSLEFWTIFANCYWERFCCLLFAFCSHCHLICDKKGRHPLMSYFQIEKQERKLFLVHNFGEKFICVFTRLSPKCFFPWTWIPRTKIFDSIIDII